jgi:hypothetical protein
MVNLELRALAIVKKLTDAAASQLAASVNPK